MLEEVMVMKRRRRMSGDQRRRQLLEVSAQLFAERGYWKTGTNDIARVAEISEPSIYRHFSTKQDLFLATAEEATQELLSSLEQASIPDLEALRAWLREEAHRGTGAGCSRAPPQRGTAASLSRGGNPLLRAPAAGAEGTAG
jgi:AcrR family transcriptional regulator